MTPGLFIVLEGPDGAGKTTQATLLAERLGCLCLPTHNLFLPGTSPIGTAIRRWFKEDGHGVQDDVLASFLMAAARRSVGDLIRSRKASGEIVICDRWLSSAMAYQRVGMTFAAHIALSTLADDPTPDLEFILHPPLAVLRKRLDDKLQDKNEQKVYANLEQIVQTYQTLPGAAYRRHIQVRENTCCGDVCELLLEQVRPLLPQ